MFRTRHLRSTTAGALVGLFLLSGAAGASASESAVSRSLSWKACYAEVGPSFECAVARVPLDYDRPNGATIDLALTRLPASDPANRIGSLFLNPGGPGGSGVDFVLGAGPFLYTEEVRAKFDLVGFDPRGIMRSTPLRCYASPEQWPPLTPFWFPITQEQEELWVANERSIVSACERRAGPILDHMSTANVARDLDVLRELVGDAQLTYAGVSYGSYLGVTYANLFPDKVRALVVDAVLDPIAWSTGRGNEGGRVPFSTRLRSDFGAQQTLGEFFRLCNAGGPQRCPFAGSAARRFNILARRLRKQPVEIVYDDGYREVIDYTVLIGYTLGALFDSGSWEEHAEWLTAVERLAAAEPVGVRPARASYARRPGYIAPRGIARPSVIEPVYPNFLEGFPGAACSDSTNPDSYDAWSANGAKADARFGYFGRLWTWVSSICAEWPGVDEDRYEGPWNAVTANPVLVVGNKFDPATRYAGALTVHKLLPRSALLTVFGWGHTSLFLSSCADERITRYLVDIATPRRGTVCRQDVVPFTQ